MAAGRPQQEPPRSPPASPPPPPAAALLLLCLCSVASLPCFWASLQLAAASQLSASVADIELMLTSLPARPGLRCAQPRRRRRCPSRAAAC